MRKNPFVNSFSFGYGKIGYTFYLVFETEVIKTSWYSFDDLANANQIVREDPGGNMIYIKNHKEILSSIFDNDTKLLIKLAARPTDKKSIELMIYNPF